MAPLPESSMTLVIQVSRLSPLVKTILASAVLVTSFGRGSYSWGSVFGVRI